MAVDRKRIYHKRDRLRQLRVFCRVARTGSITRAAEQLLLRQPAVSLQVRELEYELEATLFERRGPRIALTPAGEQLYRIAAPVVEEMERLPEAFSEKLDDLKMGTLRIAAGPAGVAFVLPPILNRFRADYPGVRITLRDSLVDGGLQLLRSNESDLLIGPKHRETKDFDYHPISTWTLVLITPEDHPLAGRESVDIQEPAAYPAVVPASTSYNREYGEAVARRLGVEINVAVEANGWRTIKSCVEAGLGISAVPSLCLTGGERLRAIPYKPPVAGGSYGIFTRRNRYLSPAADRFLRMIVSSSSRAA